MLGVDFFNQPLLCIKEKNHSVSILKLPHLRVWRVVIGLIVGLILATNVKPMESWADNLTIQTDPPTALQGGTFDDQDLHKEGHYYLKRQGTSVSATVTSKGTSLDDSSVLFTLPVGFRPHETVLREAEGWPLVDGDVDLTVLIPVRFSLAIDPTGRVRYFETPLEGGPSQLAYVLATNWTTLEVSGELNTSVDHLEGRYAIRRTGSTVSGMLTATRSPGIEEPDSASRVVLQLPSGFRPSQPIQIAVSATDTSGAPVFSLVIEPSGEVAYKTSFLRNSGNPVTYRLPVSWTTNDPSPFPTQTHQGKADLCARNKAVQDALLIGLSASANKLFTCDTVTWSDLASAESLDLIMGAGHPPLQRRDLHGLSSLTHLSVHSPLNLYTWWPADLFAATPRLQNLELELFSVQIPNSIMRDKAPNWALVRSTRTSKGLSLEMPLEPDLRVTFLTTALLSHAPNLERLTIQGIGRYLPNSLVGHNLPLQELELIDFHRKTLPEDFLKHYPQLRRLTLQSSQLGTLPEDFLQHNPQLRVLTLSTRKPNQQFPKSSWVGTRLPEQLLAHSPLLEELTLLGNGLEAMPSLAHNPRLLKLYLDFSDKFRLPRDLLDYSPELQHLTLHTTEGLSSHLLRNTPKLESLHLDLSWNPPPKFLAPVPNLKSLTIYGRSEHRAQADLLSFTPQLRSAKLLYLNTPPSSLLTHSLPQLQSLSLNRLSSTTQLAKALANTPALQSLDLRIYGFRDIDPDLFANIPLLHSLAMDVSGLVELPTGLLSHTPDLQSLELQFSDEFKELPADLLAYTPNLESLHISAGQVTALPPKFLDNTPELVSLYLWLQNVEAVPHHVFHNIPNLQSLSFWSADPNVFTSRLLARVPNLQSLTLSAVQPNDSLSISVKEDFTVHNRKLRDVALVFRSPVELPSQFMANTPHLQRMEITIFARDHTSSLNEGFLKEAPLLREFEIFLAHELKLNSDFLLNSPYLQILRNNYSHWGGYASPLPNHFQHLLWQFPYIHTTDI